MIPLTKDQLKAVVDEVFATAENLVGSRPIAVLALKSANEVIDRTVLDTVYDALVARGVIAG